MGMGGEQTTYGASVGKQCKSEAEIILCNDKDIYIYICIIGKCLLGLMRIPQGNGTDTETNSDRIRDMTANSLLQINANVIKS